MTHNAENDAPRCDGHWDGPRHPDCPWLHVHRPHTLGHHRVIPPAEYYAAAADKFEQAEPTGRDVTEQVRERRRDIPPAECDNYLPPMTCLTAPSSESGRCDKCRARPIPPGDEDDCACGHDHGVSTTTCDRCYWCQQGGAS